jgi:hypothetical protein
VILVVGACVVAGILGVASWPAEREPEYQGKKLSEWLDCGGVLQGRALPEEAQRAVQHIGTNALPCLMRWVACEQSAWSQKAADVYDRWPSSLRAGFFREWLAGKAERRWEVAMTGLDALGSDAAPAVPQLVRLAKESRSFRHRYNIIILLGSMGSAARPALPFLTQLSGDPKSDLARIAFLAAGQIERQLANGYHE